MEFQLMWRWWFLIVILMMVILDRFIDEPKAEGSCQITFAALVMVRIHLFLFVFCFVFQLLLTNLFGHTGVILCLALLPTFCT